MEQEIKSILKKPNNEADVAQERPCRSTRGSAKKVTWKPNATLVDICYLPEAKRNERINVAKGVVMKADFKIESCCMKFCDDSCSKES